MTLSMLPQPAGLLKLMIDLLSQVTFKGENSADMILWKYI